MCCQLHHSPKNMEPTVEIESTSPEYETGVLPLNYAGKLVGLVGLVGLTGFEPACGRDARRVKAG